MLEARAISRATPIATSRGTPQRVVASQYPSSREAALVTRYLTPIILASLEISINGVSDSHGYTRQNLHSDVITSVNEGKGD